MPITLIAWASGASLLGAIMWRLWRAPGIAPWRKLAASVGIAAFVYVALTWGFAPSAGLDFTLR